MLRRHELLKKITNLLDNNLILTQTAGLGKKNRIELIMT
jgi:hypothetical protein